MILNAANDSLLNATGNYYEKSNSSTILSQIPEYYIDDNKLRQYYTQMMPKDTKGRYNPKIAAFGMYVAKVSNPDVFHQQMIRLGVKENPNWKEI